MFLTTDVTQTSESAKHRIAAGITNIFRTEFKAPPKMDMVEWADKYRKLPDNSAEPGRWRTDRVPPAKEPMLVMTNKDTREVTVMSCIQLLKTELMLNTALYYIHQEPSPIMYVASKEKIAEAWSKERFTKSVNVVPEVKKLFSNNRRDQGNTILQKQFPGGQLSIVSARNPDDLAMRACRIMLFDECDKYPLNVGSGEGGAGEGDSIAVGWGRATTYGRRAKKIVACSPTVQGRSRIELEYLAGSQGMYNQQCPHCKKYLPLEWPDVIIPVNKKTGEFLPEEAYILCSKCGNKWDEGDRLRSIRNGKYIHKRPHIKHHRSYRVTSLASPFTPLTMLANEFVDATGNPELLKAFYNTRMARTWREQGDQPDWEMIYNRREQYEIGKIPEGGIMLTMGMDVQKGGVFYEIVAYGRRKVSWSIDIGYLAGDINDDAFREQIKKFWDKYYKYPSGHEAQCEIINIDSGYATHAVYSLVREYGSDRVRAIKGDKEGRMHVPIGTPTPVDVHYDGQRFNRGLMLWHVGSGIIKTQLYNWLQLKRPNDEALKNGKLYPSGYCHFPPYDEEFFKQLTAEQRVLGKNSKGYTVYIWEKLRKDNHYLDCRAYANAGAIMLQIERMNDDDWDKREAIVNREIDSIRTGDDNIVVHRGKKRRKGNWISGD